MHKHKRLIAVQYNDVNVQHTNITGSMKLCNAKVQLVCI